MKRTTKSLIFILLFASCNEFSQDYIELSGLYFFRNKGAHKRSINSQNGLSKNVIYADVIDYKSNDSFIVAQQIPNLINYKYELGSSLYLRYIAYADYLRNPKIINSNLGRFYKGTIENDSINYKIFLNKGASEKNSIQDINLEEEIADSLLKNDPKYKKIVYSKENYWIIRISKDTLLGPLSKSEYLSERELLHIPKEVKLKFEQ